MKPSSMVVARSALSPHDGARLPSGLDGINVRKTPLFAGVYCGRLHPGVILVSQRLAVSEAIELLLLIWSATDALEWENRIVDLRGLAD